MAFWYVEADLGATCPLPEIASATKRHRTINNVLLLSMLPFLRRFGKAAVVVELSALAGLYFVFHDINTGGVEARRKWDERVPFLIDTFHAATGDDRVIEHRKSGTGGGRAPSNSRKNN